MVEYGKYTELSPDSPIPLNSTEHLIVFKHTVLVVWPTIALPLVQSPCSHHMSCVQQRNTFENLF